MELPSSFGLTPVARDDGRLNLVGKDDTGAEYVARVTSSNEVAECDLNALKSNDREATNARDFCAKLVADKQRHEQQCADSLLADYMEPAERVAHAGTHKAERTVGYSRVYAANFDKAFNRRKSGLHKGKVGSGR